MNLLSVAGCSLGLALIGCKGPQRSVVCGPADPRAAPVFGVSALGHYDIKSAELPPVHEDSTENAPNVIPRPAGASLILPEGFSAAPFAEGLFKRPRWLAVAPNGDVFVADADADSILVLRDTDGDGRADAHFVFATDQKKPFGMAFHEGWLYVGHTDKVVRFRYAPGQTAASGPPEKITELPGRGYREHWTRNVAIHNGKLYVTIGSKSNAEEEPAPRASVLEMNLDGSDRRTFVSGTRNPIGLAFHPETHALWAVVQERDHRGEDLVPDYVTELKPGAFYGWPYGYIGRRQDPAHQNEHTEEVRTMADPDVLLQAHSAAMGLVFYQGSMFPEEYKNDAFVALHGSWNRVKRTGYKIVRIRMKQGRPIGGYDDFAVGWMLGEDRCDVWGRPVGLAVAKDGALLVADDGGHLIWSIRYASKKD
ncbi:PQQ-dependent sugar dehydrogenase [Pendulispora albinea]|uniref:Sorbosone dehydrogenase family protein n=1 Tax=Pendulispora albinea TaxID=2741071 RepID=A0ABZ2M8W6_9BACT